MTRNQHYITHRWNLSWALAIGCLGIVACGEGAVTITDDTPGAVIDAMHDMAADVPGVGDGMSETTLSVDASWEVDVSTIGLSCASDDDCPQGACIFTPAGSLCSFPCEDGETCPPAFTCLAGAPSMCMPLHEALCRPCLGDDDCGDAATGARCALFANGNSFCASICGEGCPVGYACAIVSLLDSTTTQRCVPQDGAPCTCSEPAIAGALGTGCQVVNEHGTCHGIQVCEAEGLGNCDAHAPAPEACGGGDENCNGPIDEPGALGCLERFEDADQDGLGEPGSGQCLCQPEGVKTALVGGDCDDSDETVAGCVDYYADLDGDGWGDGDDMQCLCVPLEPYTAVAIGCEGDVVTPCAVYFKDEDGDGLGGEESQCLCEMEGAYTAAESGDCDDTMASVGLCVAHFYDADGDGVGVVNLSECLCTAQGLYTALVSGDCDDNEPLSAPGLAETCDLIDNDCNGFTDEEGASGCVTYLYDGDADSFGVSAQSKCLCASFGKYTATMGGDCNDLDPAIYPGQPCSPPACEGFIISGVCPEGTCGEGSEAAPCPGGFVCSDAMSCRTDCATKSDCAPGHYCAAGACAPESKNGTACAIDDACASDHCGAGFCCAWGACCGGNDADCGDGNACTLTQCNGAFQCQSTKLDGGVCKDASCAGMVFEEASVCVMGLCSGAGKKTICGADSTCQDASCSLAGCAVSDKPQGSACGEFQCTGFELIQSKSCDGAGTCSEGGGVTVCADSLACLDEVACRSSCESSAHCQPDTYCDAGACLPLKPDGSPCAGDDQCGSGSCQGGFCCAGCCDGGTLGTTLFGRAAEICGESYFAVEGASSCRRVISDFGVFSHDDKDASLQDSAMAHLSSGKAANMGNQQPGENTGTSGADPDGSVGTVYDLCGFTVKLKVPANAKGMAFDFIFFSAEYPEYVGSSFNDSFNVMLNSTNFNGNVAFDSNGNPISINNVLFNTFGNALAGTGYQNNIGGSTGWLTTTVPLVPGETITLRFVVYDEGDHIYDSDVLVNNFRWLEFQPGVGPVTE